MLSNGVCSIRVNNCGMNFEWMLFQFTPTDCKNLCQAVKGSKQLTVLRLHHSQVADGQARLLISYLLDHPVLRELGGCGCCTIAPPIITHALLQICRIINLPMGQVVHSVNY